MAKKLRRKQQRARPEQAGGPPSASTSGPRRSLALIVAALAFLLYSNTLTHSWAFDDYSLIKENTLTRKGIAAIPEILTSTYRAGYFNTDVQLYRPLSRVVFAVEWDVFGDNPQAAHWVNVALYALTGFLLFFVLTTWLNGNLLAAFLAASLFAAHPIHTEVVANIKSLDEILGFLFFIVSAGFVHRYLTGRRLLDLALALVAFLLSLLSKESAITFIAVVPLMLFFFTDTPSSRNVTISAAFAGVAAIFLLIRMQVIGTGAAAGIDVVDNVLAAAHGPERLATAVMIMGMYLKLLFFPYPLISDYSFRHIPLVGPGNIWFLLSLAAYAALAVYGLIRFRKRDAVAFGILYFFITASVASNILMLIGTSFGERLMYAPSLGFCLAVAILIDRVLGKRHEPAFAQTLAAFFRGHARAVGTLTAVAAVYSMVTITRNRDWYDNLTLFSADVEHAPDSARTHYYLGNYLSQDDFIATLASDSAKVDASRDRATRELTKAIEIYPEFADAWQQLGKIELQRRNFKEAEAHYGKAISLNPGNPLYLNNYGNLLFTVGRLDEAKARFEEAIRLNPGYAHAYGNLASVYGAVGEGYRKRNDQAAAKQNFDTAIAYFKKAIEADPEYAEPYRLLGITYRNIGDDANAAYYLSRYEALIGSGAYQ